MTQSSPSIVLITGQAGSGHSTALKVLEDQGYKSVDNLPLALVDQLVAIEVETEGHNLAFCVDARTSGFDAPALHRLIDNLRQKFEQNVKIVHMRASQSEIMRRYQSTRRHHPLTGDHTIEEAVLLDEARMSQIEDHADLVIDTTAISPNMLRQNLLAGVGVVSAQTMAVRIVSFAYKNGIPENVDYVFDVRFLRNPHWDPALRALTGKEPKIIHYVKSDENFDLFTSHLCAMAGPIIERAIQDGRPQITFAFGCTGGKHRSVSLAETFDEWAKKQGHDTILQHRELAQA